MTDDQTDPFDGQFGIAEKHMGQDAYQANVKLSESMTEQNHALARLLTAKSDMWTITGASLRFLVLLIVPVAIMGYVWLFKAWVL